MYNCIKCNTQLIWQSDFDYEDIFIEDENNPFYASIVSYYSCPICNELHTFIHDCEVSLLYETQSLDKGEL